MFVVEVGTVLTAIVTVAVDRRGTRPPACSATWSRSTSWLLLTVLFANFAEALAEARGKAQADSLRKTAPGHAGLSASTRPASRSSEVVSRPTLQAGDLVVVEAGQVIPGDGEIVEGVASVDESAITGESAPVIREAGGDRSGVTGGTRVLSDRIVVRVTAGAGRVVPRPHDRPGRRGHPPADAQRDRPVARAVGLHADLPDRHRRALADGLHAERT